MQDENQKAKKSVVDVDLETSKKKYVIETGPEYPKLPALFVFCKSRRSGKLMLVWHWPRILKNGLHHQNFFNLLNQNNQ